jgi:LPS sulfotransferase NodH
MLGLSMTPQRAYIVCATPRSGSTLLCEMLAASGVAGRPSEHVETLRALGRPAEPREYFDGLDDPEVLDLLARSAPPRPHTAPLRERLDAEIRHATTPNGVFGTKVMWGYMGDLQARLAELPELAGLRESTRLSAVLGGVRLRYVHVLRDDAVAQAVSLWRAVQTRAWRADDAAACAPRYSFAGIDHLVRLLEGHERAWRAWFAAEGVEPLSLRYDEIAGDPASALRRTLEHVGVTGVVGAALPQEPPLRRQAGAESLAWAERYRAERG